MELWIRSQDKKQLLKVNDGLFIANGFENTPDTFIGLKNVGHIGKYATEKRALEILDEIQKFIINEDVLNTEFTPNKYTINSSSTKSSVYQMPKE